MTKKQKNILVKTFAILFILGMLLSGIVRAATLLIK